MPTTLITGPVRSGKSRFAERLAREARGHVTYVATADPRPGDSEWEARLAAHQRSRPPEWEVVESARRGPDLIEIISTASPESAIIVDSLGTWLAAQMGAPNMGAETTPSHLKPPSTTIAEDLTSRCARLRRR